jgi:predicted ATPase
MGAEHPKVGTLMHYARSLLRLGYVDQAQARYEESLAEARRSNPFSLGLGLLLALEYLHLGDDVVSLASLADELLALSHEQGFMLYWASAKMLHGWCEAATGRHAEGIAEIVAGMAACGRLYGSLFLAKAYGMAGQAREGLESLGEAPKEMNLHGGAQISLVRARLLASLGDSVAAEESLRQAIATAKGRQAKYLELLAVGDLARLWSAQGRRAEARELMAPVYGWFTEGLNTPILREAKALLDELVGPLSS